MPQPTLRDERRWLWQAPVYADPARTRRAALIHSFVLGIFGITNVMYVIVTVLQPSLLAFVLERFAVNVVIAFGVMVLNRRGSQRAAGIALVAGYMALIGWTALSAGGVRSPGVQFFFVLSMVAAVSLGERAGVITGAACVATTFGLVVAESYGLIPAPRASYSQWTLWVLNTTYVSYFVFALLISMRTLGDALTQRAAAESRLQLALASGRIGVWEQEGGVRGDFLADARSFEVAGLAPPADGRLSYSAWTKLIHPDDVDAAVAALDRLATGDGTVHLSYRLRGDDGLERHVDVTAVARGGGSGGAGGAIGMIADVTERRLVERERERLLADLGERVKEAQLLLFASRLMNSGQGFGREFLQTLVDRIPAAWKYPDACGARIRCGDVSVTTSEWRQSPWTMSASFSAGDQRGVIEVVYTDERDAEVEGPFLAEERRILDSLAEMLGSYLERHLTAESLGRAEQARRATEATLRTAFGTSPAAMSILRLDDDLRFIEVNEAFERQTGWSRDEVFGKCTSDLDLYVDPSKREELRRLILVHGAARGFEHQLRRKDGSVGISSVNVQLFDVAGAKHAVVVSLDVTDERRQQTEIERYRKHLEDLVQQRTAELMAARDDADAANRAKSRFLANMSHEIRTPMNAVLGFTQILLRSTGLSAEQRKHVETINRAGDHLVSLIDGILHLAKVEAGHVERSDVDLDLWQLFDDVARLFSPRATDKGLEFVVDVDPAVPRRVRGDGGKIRQVLANLLGNAIKFTARGVVVVRVGMQGPERVRIEVEDSGAGVSVEEQPRLFQKFEQTESGRTSGQGTGLGLAICRELVHVMGGEIGVRSEVGQGSVFWFDVPVTPLAATTDAPRAAGGPLRLATGQPPVRVLIADDVEDNRTLLRELLVEAGFETREAHDGAEAVQVFEQWHPHLVLIDVRMPVLDGIEATRRIRAAKGGADVKVVVVTASAFDTDAAVAFAAGAEAFLKKPVRERELLERIGALLDLRYADPEAAPASLRNAYVPTPEDVAALPAQLRAELRDATIKAQLEQLLKRIDIASTHDARLGAALREIAERFAYDRLLELLDPTTADS